jgi:hypothetical protein
MDGAGVGLFALLIDGTLELVPRREGKLSPDEIRARDILAEEEVDTPLAKAARIERIGALVPVHLPCGHRADVVEIVTRMRKGAVTS